MHTKAESLNSVDIVHVKIKESDKYTETASDFSALTSEDLDGCKAGLQRISISPQRIKLQKEANEGKIREWRREEAESAFLLPQPKPQLTFYDHFSQGLAGADVVGGHTFVRSAVAQSDVGNEQPPVLCGLCPGRQAGPARPAPLKLDGM